MALAFPTARVRKLLPGIKSSVPAIGKRGLFQRLSRKLDLVAETEQPAHEPDEIVIPKGHLPGNWYRLGISEFANWGNIYTKRIAILSGRFYWPMIAVGVFAGYHLIINPASQFFPEVATLPHIPVSMNLDPMPPAWFGGRTAIDGKTYFDLGGGLQGDSALSWMSSYRPSPVGMSTEDLAAYVASIKVDLPKFGKNFVKWDMVWRGLGKDQSGITFTSADKAIAVFGERLRTGLIVAVDGEAVPLVAHVAGEWSITLFKGNACRTLLGPTVAGCTDYRAKGGEISKEARTVLMLIDPRRV